MRNVLVYRSLLLPYSEVFIRDQAQACRSWRPILVGRQKLDEVPLEPVAVRILGPRPTAVRDRIAVKLRNALGHPEGIALLRRDIPSLLHAHFGPDAIEAAVIASALGIPMIVTLHGFDIMTDRRWWEDGRSGPSMRNYPAALLRLASQSNVHFVAVSEAVRHAALEFGIPSGKISVHYIGIDPDAFRPGPTPITQRSRRILFVGRLVEKKGCELMLRAMPKVLHKVPDAQAVIIGDGPLRLNLELLARSCGGRVQFLGAQNHDRVKEELARARVFCLPSIRASNGDAEGFGLVLLESQACGVPVVSSALGGSDEGLLDGKTGFRVPENNVETLANGLAEILLNDQLATQMAAEGPRFVRARFDLARCTSELEWLYDCMAVPAKTKSGADAFTFSRSKQHVQ